jgi:DNA-binding MarR family transcriptional regulator
MEPMQEQLQIFVRRFGLLNASCCDECCGQQLSMAQSHILSEVRRVGNPSMQRVADELGLDITTFSRQVKGLERKGLISRQVSPEDRRVSLLGLTEAGREVLERIDRYLEERVEALFAGLTSFERETVVRSLELLNGALAGGSSGATQPERKVVCCK